MQNKSNNVKCLTVDVKTCAQMLGLGLRTTYRLFERSYREHSPLHVARFGTVYRISISSIQDLFSNTGGF